MKTKMKNWKVAKFMGYPEFAVGQKWKYHRQLDESRPPGSIVTIKEIREDTIALEEDMAYESYGKDYFDGRVFSPIPEMKHVPDANYQGDWNLLMEVVDKVERTNHPRWKKSTFRVNILPNYCSIDVGVNTSGLDGCIYEYTTGLGQDTRTKIELVYNALVRWVEWYNDYIIKINYETKI